MPGLGNSRWLRTGFCAGRALAFERLESRSLLAADLAAGGAATIAGRVYDMAASAPAGIAGVELRLLNEIGAPIAAAFTDAQGSYSFAGLGPGLYAVAQTQPTGYADGPDSIGLAGGQLLTNDLLGEIALTGGEFATGYNFGEYGSPANAPQTIDHLPPLYLAGGQTLTTTPIVNLALPRNVPLWTPDGAVARGSARDAIAAAPSSAPGAVAAPAASTHDSQPSEGPAVSRKANDDEESPETVDSVMESLPSSEAESLSSDDRPQSAMERASEVAASGADDSRQHSRIAVQRTMLAPPPGAEATARPAPVPGEAPIMRQAERPAARDKSA